jgi:hypothetical protein
VPALPPGVTYVQAVAGDAHTVARRNDGDVVAFGYNSRGECNIPTPPIGTRYIDFDAYYLRTVLRRSDGWVVSLGYSPSNLAVTPPLPAGQHYEDVAASGMFNVALRTDGTAVQWGSISTGPYYIPRPVLPFGVHFVAVDGGYSYTLARLSDGTVVTWGTGPFGEHRVPQPWPGTSVVQVSANFVQNLIRIGPTSTYTGFARGCAGTLPPARLVPRGTPFLGERQVVHVFDLPQNAGVHGTRVEPHRAGLARPARHAGLLPAHHRGCGGAADRPTRLRALLRRLRGSDRRTVGTAHRTWGGAPTVGSLGGQGLPLPCPIRHNVAAPSSPSVPAVEFRDLPAPPPGGERPRS